MNPRTQLDAVIAEHMDPTSTAQFEAAERMVQAAYNLSLDRIAEIETAAKGVCAIAVSHNYNGDSAMEEEVEKLAALLDWSGKR